MGSRFRALTAIQRTGKYTDESKTTEYVTNLKLKYEKKW